MINNCQGCEKRVPNMSIKIPVSIGEIVDKITILEIKSERIHDAEKLKHIKSELDMLNLACNEAGLLLENINKEYVELKKINERLWDIEDWIRDKERLGNFDKEFIELARSVYFTNDERDRIKKEINLKLGSDLVEEKSYSDYE